jgi:hypothetical protein
MMSIEALLVEGYAGKSAPAGARYVPPALYL